MKDDEALGPNGLLTGNEDGGAEMGKAGFSFKKKSLFSGVDQGLDLEG